MELAIQVISNDKTVRNKRVRDLKDCYSQSLATQAKKGEQIFSKLHAFGKVFNSWVTIQ